MNWGHKLTIVISTFVGFMGYMVYRSVSADFQLVEKEYYKRELTYQELINGAQNVSALSRDVRVFKQDEHVIIELPEEMKNQKVSGTLWFYCAYDAAQDKQLTFAPDTKGYQSFLLSTFKKGTYTVKIEWNNGQQHFYSEQPLNL